MKKRLVLQSFLITLTVLSAVFIASVCTFYFIQQQKIQDTLVEQTKILACLYEENPAAIENLSLNEARITVISDQGEVLFDTSMYSGEITDNHLSRQEVRAALNGKPEVVKRYSSTLKRNMFYYARVVKTDETTAVLRVALPESNVWTYTGAGIAYIIIAIVFSLVASYVLAERLSSKVGKSFKNMLDNLRNINSGDYATIALPDKDDLNLSILNELNEIVKNLQSSYNSVQNEKTKLYNIINNMTQGVIVSDKDLKIILMNNVAASLFSQETTGKTLDETIPDAQLCSMMKQALGNNDKEPFEYAFGDKDLAVNAFKISVNDCDDTGIILISDVTKEKELARQKSVFFANASHELKTPLTSVQGLSENLLAREDESSPSFKYLKRIYTESVRLHNIVMDMLYISRLESKNVDKINENADLRKIAEESVASYSKEIEEKSLTVKITGKAVFKGDAHNIYELITNLIGNAVHYNKPDGKISVTLRQSDKECSISVSDTGIGIAPEHIPHVCERFYRVDKSRSKSTGGTGLGLAIVKHIVMLYNGILNIDSTLDKGTCVKIVLPKDNG